MSTPIEFCALLRETIAWRAGDGHYAAWERADQALRRGVTVQFTAEDGGFTFGRIDWRDVAANYDRCEICGGRVHHDQLLWIDGKDERVRVCDACQLAKPWQQRMRCVNGCGRHVAANGRYCLDCIIQGDRAALDFITARVTGPQTIVRELDVMEFECAMRPFSPRQRAIVLGMMAKPAAWHPDGKVFCGDEAIVPLFITTSGMWLVVKAERGVPKDTGRRYESGQRILIQQWNPVGFVPVTPKGEQFVTGMDEAWDAAQRWAGELRRANSDRENPEGWGDAITFEIVVTPDRADLLRSVVNGEVPRRRQPSEE